LSPSPPAGAAGSSPLRTPASEDGSLVIAAQVLPVADGRTVDEELVVVEDVLDDD
jgi:hypothetical protein